MVHDSNKDGLLSYINDAFKDAYGFRPRGDIWESFKSMSVAQLKNEAERISADVADSISEQRKLEAAAAEKFEERLELYMAVGALDFLTALRWEMDSWGDEYMEEGYYEYLNGLAYGYIAKRKLEATR